MQSSITFDTIFNCSNDLWYSFHPETYKFLPTDTVSDIFTTLLINTDGNGHLNHMDHMKKLQLDMSILNLLKSLVNPNLTEIPDQTNNT